MRREGEEAVAAAAMVAEASAIGGGAPRRAVPCRGDVACRI